MSDETASVRTFGRYHAVGELGRGGMGVVYRGFDPAIGRTVALKTIAFSSDPREAQQLRERLYREAAAAGTLTHPNIVTIYDIVEDGGTTAVAMEFVEGRSLADLLAEKGALPLDQALDLFEQICAALDYAGARGLVHRDIKPANVLLTAEGRPKITDFGIARITVSGVTQTSTIMGSPSYMSPEQVRGQPLDPRSDLFSAAVVLYEMLAGARPFGGDDVATTMYRIVNEPPRALEQLNPTINPAVSAVLVRALSKNPAERYQTGAEFVAELKRSISIPVLPLASSLPPIPVLPDAAPRSPMRWIIAGLGLVFVAVVGLALLAGGPDAPQQPPAGQPPAASRAGGGPGPGTEAAPGVELRLPETRTTPQEPLGPRSTVPPPRPTGPAAAPPVGVAARDASATGRASRVDAGAAVGRDGTRTLGPDAGSTGTAASNPEPRVREPIPVRPPKAEPRTEPADPPSVPVTPAPTGAATIEVEFTGAPYAVTLVSDGSSLGRVAGAGSVVQVDAGTLRLRAVSEAVFLDADLGTVTVRPGERKRIAVPGTASVVLGVRGDEYAGVRIWVDGRPLLGPYPAQVARVAAGSHQVSYRWSGGSRANLEISETVTLNAGAHYVVRAVPDNGQLVVQQVR